MKRLLPLLLISVVPASGWRCDGHQIVALIAESHLNPRALAGVMDLLRSQPFDHSTRKFWVDGPADAMADSSTWADDVKREEKNGPWHYIDIPRGVEHADLRAYCEPVGPSVDGKDRPGCILTAMRYEQGILRDEAAAPADRAKALRYLIHFMGDLHQPLHTTDNNDHGGNCVPLQFLDAPKRSNLHDVWDYQVLERDFASMHLGVVEVAQHLNKKFLHQWHAWGEGPIDFDRWAWEGHHIADELTYGKLRPKVPVEPPDPTADCRVESRKIESLHVRVDQAYQNAAAPVVERELAKAGYRLAGLLNEVWP
ncbi:MAG: S1/P1 nuclease [Acidobacteriota bacterium]|nr:S1/P1 nuclease [Acidobacteriota bacterium]